MDRLVVVSTVLALAACSEQGAAPVAGGAPSCEPAAPPFGTDPDKGESFPDLVVVACDGTRVGLGAIRCGSKLTFLSVGAGWCQPCREEAPALEAGHRALADRGVSVIGILFQDGQSLPATTAFCVAWVDEHALTMPVYIDPVGRTLDYFEVTQTPLNLLMRTDGKVLWSQTGKVGDVEGTIEPFLE